MHISSVLAVTLGGVALVLSSAACLAAEPPRRVFAHYMVCFATYGEAAGVEGYKKEIRQAQEAGIDGFALNVGAWSREKYYQRRTKMIFQAARELAEADGNAREPFGLFFSVDLGKVEDILDMVRSYGRHPNHLRQDGKVVVSTFAHAGVPWREKVLDPLAEDGLEVFFVPHFYPRPVTEHPSREVVLGQFRQYDRLVDGLFYFGAAGTPGQLAASNTAQAQAAGQAGKLAMCSYTPHYWGYRQPSRRYFETEGGKGTAEQWRALIDARPRWVEIVTWNDFNESSWVSPVENPGRYFKELLTPPRPCHAGYLEISKHFIEWFKTGKRPAIEREGLFFFYRTHPKAAEATGEDRPVTEFHGETKDAIYLTTMLKAPADVVVRIGDRREVRSLPAGLSHAEVPFVPGRPRFQLVRKGNVLAEAEGPMEIEARPNRYNFFPASGYVYAPAARK